MSDLFSEFASDGNAANDFRKNQLLPALAKHDLVILDFKNVTNMTSNFANALFANLVEANQGSFPKNLKLRDCNETVKVFIGIARSMGIRALRDSTFPTRQSNIEI